MVVKVRVGVLDLGGKRNKVGGGKGKVEEGGVEEEKMKEEMVVEVGEWVKKVEEGGVERRIGEGWVEEGEEKMRVRGRE